MSRGRTSPGKEHHPKQEAGHQRVASHAKRSQIRYPVALSSQQRTYLQQRVLNGSLSARREMYARILLDADQNTSLPLTDAQIASALSISQRTVLRVRQRFIAQGVEAMFPAAPDCSAAIKAAFSGQERSRASTIYVPGRELRERTRR